MRVKLPIRAVTFLFITLITASGLGARNIEGVVVVKKKLTKRRVTAAVPLYERGTAVGLDPDTEADPLALERSRVAVYLEGKIPSGSVPAEPVATIEQINRRFSPETLVVTAGSKVSFPNHDPVFHNIFSLSSPKTFDLGNYPKGDTRVVTFSEPGVVYVNCHLHPNMSAAIVVTPNRWNTKADREGHFALKDVPPGKYRVVAWHRTAGFFRQEVEVVADRDDKIEFLIPIDENGRKLEPGKLQASAIATAAR